MAVMVRLQIPPPMDECLGCKSQLQHTHDPELHVSGSPDLGDIDDTITARRDVVEVKGGPLYRPPYVLTIRILSFNHYSSPVRLLMSALPI